MTSSCSRCSSTAARSPELLVARRRALDDVALETLGLQPSLDDLARELLVAALEADVELLAEIRETRSRLGVSLAERLVLVHQRAHALLAARELFFHLAHGVLQQHVGLLDSVEHGMHVRREQPRHSIDERHEIRLLATVVKT
jgi:hypothetical protein